MTKIVIIVILKKTKQKEIKKYKLIGENTANKWLWVQWYHLFLLTEINNFQTNLRAESSEGQGTWGLGHESSSWSL